MADTALDPRLEPPSLEGYEVEESLGAGLTGEAFRARTEDGLEVVLKVVDPERGQLLPLAARLSEEEMHPCLARVLAIGEDDQGRGCLVLDQLEGQPIGARAMQGLPKKTVLQLLTQVGEALAALHHNGGAHGNLKPTNVLVQRTEAEAHAIVCDTGILLRGEAELPPGASGLNYLAPERLRTLVEKLGQAEPRPEEDVYGFAALVAETLSGKPIFAGVEGVADLLDAKESRRYRLVGITAGSPPFDLRALDDMLKRSLSPEPSDRPTNWDGILAALTPKP